MTKKLKTFILLLAVVIVWGIIIYRIIDATSASDDAVLPTTASIANEPYNDYSVPKDTSHLLLNYKDPFGLKKQKINDTAQAVVRRIHRTELIKPAMNWSFIKYSGYVRNPGSKKIVALLSINGRNVMLCEGESAENVKLVKNMRDSIKIIFNGKTKYISMNQRTL